MHTTCVICAQYHHTHQPLLTIHIQVQLSHTSRDIIPAAVPLAYYVLFPFTNDLQIIYIHRYLDAIKVFPWLRTKDVPTAILLRIHYEHVAYTSNLSHTCCEHVYKLAVGCLVRGGRRGCGGGGAGGGGRGGGGGRLRVEIFIHEREAAELLL